jgi:hypothetical protein
MSTCCAYVEAVLYKLACCCPVLDNNNRIFFTKVISTLSSREAVWSPLVRGDRTSLSTIGVNRAVCGV